MRVSLLRKDPGLGALGEASPPETRFVTGPRACLGGYGFHRLLCKAERDCGVSMGSTATTSCDFQRLL